MGRHVCDIMHNHVANFIGHCIMPTKGQERWISTWKTREMQCEPGVYLCLDVNAQLSYFRFDPATRISPLAAGFLTGLFSLTMPGLVRRYTSRVFLSPQVYDQRSIVLHCHPWISPCG